VRRRSFRCTPPSQVTAPKPGLGIPGYFDFPDNGKENSQPERKGDFNADRYPTGRDGADACIGRGQAGKIHREFPPCVHPIRKRHKAIPEPGVLPDITPRSSPCIAYFRFQGMIAIPDDNNIPRHARSGRCITQ
jgi:hypothetical protein